MKIAFLDTSTVTRGNDVDLHPLRCLGEWTAHEHTTPSQTGDRVRDTSVVISNKVVLGPEEIGAAGASLKLIAVAATGTNNVDLEAAKQAGVQVCNVSGYSTDSVAQHTLALILNLCTSMSRYVNEPAEWADSPIFTRLDYPVVELRGQTLGLVGAGHIGGRVGELAEAFGMSVQCLARNGSRDRRHPRWPRPQRDVFFQTSDIVSLHCPLTSSTRRLINAETLSLMKQTALLINTGRGELVDEDALTEALRGGRIAGAGLDVLSEEPPRRDHPLLQLRHPRLLITPHSAWSSREARQRLVDGVAANIRTFLETGTPRNPVA